MRRPAPLILGAGPAGAAAAIVLARAGHAPVMLERTAEDADALCGGFLSWRSIARLDRLGVATAGAAVCRLRLFAGSRRVEAALPRPAIGVSRLTLDRAMRQAAATAGAGIERGVAARRWDDRGLHLADGASIAPADLFLATGKHDLRGLTRPHGAAGADPMLGIRVRLTAGPTIDRLVGDAIELHLFDGGYAGLVRQEDGANLCMAVRRSRLTAAGGVDALLDRIGARRPLGERLACRVRQPADAVANVPYGWRASGTRPGLWRLGDQAAVITSLAGEGMGIALASGADAAAAWLSGMTAPAWQARLARRAARPVTIAALAGRIGTGPTTAPLLLLAARIPGAAALIARATRMPDRFNGSRSFSTSQASPA